MTGLWDVPTHKIAHIMNAKIWIEKTGKTLRLVWYYQGKKKQLSLGVRDNLVGWAIAEQRKAQVSIDLEAGYYDPTLLKYRPRKLGANPTELAAVELFEKYTAFIIKDKGLAPGSMHRYKAIASKLRECLMDKPAHQVSESVAKNAVTIMGESLSGQTVKTYLFLIRACWEWAKGKYHLAEGSNPWENCIDRVKVYPKQQPKPFTIAELQSISNCNRREV
jgi:integrase